MNCGGGEAFPKRGGGGGKGHVTNGVAAKVDRSCMEGWERGGEI